MRRLVAFRAAALLAALALALAACSGGGPPPAPAATPQASPAAEAPSTPAPTAEASLTADAPSPAPTPEAACANGVAVEEPEARPGLVADCVALLASRDALRGEAPLDWGGDLAIGRWEGVAVEGEPPRVVRLDLRGKGLTGAIPEWPGGMERLSTLILADNALTGGIPRPIGRLPWLDEVRLAGNALTGCVPSAFGDAKGDAAYLGLPWCLRYDRLDATGAVAEAGGWAILGADGDVLATWEGLRSEAATLRVHQTDAGGTSCAAEFGAVSEGDLFEWRKAGDCWVRYHVTGPPVRPAARSGRWEFPVEWMTYAATGEGCTGTVAPATVLRVDEAAPDIRAPIDSPIRHDRFLLYPPWTGELDAQVWTNTDSTPTSTDIAVVRRHPFWRDPELPTGWTLHSAVIGFQGMDGYMATYLDAGGGFGADVSVARPRWWPWLTPAGSGAANVWETRVIDGHPALVYYSPTGDPTHRTMVHIFDRGSGIMYSVDGISFRITGFPDAVIAIARSLLPTDGAP